jgi:hypothetical protein
MSTVRGCRGVNPGRLVAYGARVRGGRRHREIEYELSPRRREERHVERVRR